MADTSAPQWGMSTHETERCVMDNRNAWVCQDDIDHFRRLLAKEQYQPTRKVLSSLLIEVYRGSVPAETKPAGPNSH